MNLVRTPVLLIGSLPGHVEELVRVEEGHHVRAVAGEEPQRRVYSVSGIFVDGPATRRHCHGDGEDRMIDRGLLVHELVHAEEVRDHPLRVVSTAQVVCSLSMMKR